MKLRRLAFPRLALAPLPVLLLAALGACGEGDSGAAPGGGGNGAAGESSGAAGENSGAAGESSGEGIVLTGAVQKGPFVLGTSVAASLLDATLEPTGDVFNTQTENDLGEFELGIPVGGPVSLEGQGFYYNEVTAAFSQGNLTLRALYVPEQTGAQSAYINMVTHLTYGRVESLVAGGAVFADAVAQAEDELCGELAITPAEFRPDRAGIALNLLGGDDDANAYLLAVSSVLAQAAYERDASSPDAELQMSLNTISNDLSEDGTLLSATSEKITAGLAALDADAVMEGLLARLLDLGSNAAVPDMNRVLDQDGDGLVNADDNCRLDPNPEQEDGVLLRRMRGARLGGRLRQRRSGLRVGRAERRGLRNPLRPARPGLLPRRADLRRGRTVGLGAGRTLWSPVDAERTHGSGLGLRSRAHGCRRRRRDV